MTTLSIYDNLILAVASVSGFIIVAWCFYVVFALIPEHKKKKLQKKINDARLTWTHQFTESFLK